ncbi:antitermination protein [Pantoea sp. V108_6]|uniref:antitermination protein Q n=1 Tax=Pantoea sp. V108_6 TaxID=3044235 RepID=UPI00249DC9F6|nr:antitermination protein [Pantoea sp. V108_6]MDI3365200.1 antitermination protein [Pantoea sp. V108_6]
MNIESALKHFSPKTMNISDTSRATASEALSGTDVMGAFGMCQSKSPMGFAALMAKSGVSPDDKKKAVSLLTEHAKAVVPRLIVKAAGRKLPLCLSILSSMAFDEYAKSAASKHTCPDCEGRGVINSIANVMVHPGCGKKTPPKYRLDTVESECVTCHGKGFISARCRCNGSGEVRDIEQSKLRGVPVMKTCDRCNGVGFRRSTGTKAFKVICSQIPDLHIRTWTRNWKPFFDELVMKLEAEESHAGYVFKIVTTHTELSAIAELSKHDNNK